MKQISNPLKMGKARNASGNRRKQVSTNPVTDKYNFSLSTCSTLIHDNYNNFHYDYLYNNPASQAMLLKQYIYKTEKLLKTIANIWYNKQCLSHHVTPNYARIKTNTNTFSSRLAVQKAQEIWVKSEIRTLYIKKDKINKILYNLHLKLTDILPTDSLLTFIDNTRETINLQMTKKYETMNKKLRRLCKPNIKSNNTSTKNNHKFHDRLVNLTDVHFTDKQIELLEKGLKHNLNRNDPLKNIQQNITDTEYAITLLPHDIQEHTRHKAVDLIGNIIINKNNAPVNTDDKTVNKIKNKLKQHNLKLAKADKGNTTVIMTMTDYIDKTHKFITQNKFTNCDKDPTQKFQSQIRNILKNPSKVFDPSSTFRLTNMNPSAPHLIALPKIHKPDIPIRPIVNYKPAPGYKLAKHIANILKTEVKLKNAFTIKNTLELVNKIKDVPVTPLTKLVSFDIKNLYTSIPTCETITIIRNSLLNTHDINFTNELTNITDILLEQNYFKFNNKIYKQTDGLGMGNPTSAIIMEIFMQSLEDKHINELMTRFGVAHYFRYVDDTLCIIENETDTSNDILTYLNSIHPNIQYTCEKETHNAINFLDVTIEKTDGRFSFSIYRKPTTTDNIIHATSNHPNQHKLASFRHMINRINSIPLTTSNYKKELDIIYQIADNNGYSKITIDKLLTKKPKTNKEKTNNTTNDKWVTFTYTGKETYTLTNFFKKLGINTALKTNNNLKQILNTNLEKESIFDRAGVYKLTCTCGSSYVGQTGRKLKDRYKEHIRSFKLGKLDSNFANHLKTQGHEPDTINNSMSLLHCEQKGKRLTILENLEIYKLKKFNGNIINEQLNTSSDTTFLPLALILDNKKRKHGQSTSTSDETEKNY